MVVAAQLVPMTPTMTSPRMLGQIPNFDLDFRLTMYAPYDRQYQRGPVRPHQVCSPFLAISNPRCRWRLFVASFSQGGQRPAGKTSFLMIGRFDGGADHRFGIPKVLLQHCYRFWASLAEEFQ
jgi:hypothetical protein